MRAGELEDAGYTITMRVGGEPAARAPAGAEAEADVVRAGARAVKSIGATSAGAPPSSSPRSNPLFSAGARIGHYELLRELGRGGMGTVFLARDTRLARLVAIKIVVQRPLSASLDGGGIGLRRTARHLRRFGQSDNFFQILPVLYRALAAQRPDLLPRLVFMTGDTLGGDMTGFLSETGVRVLEKPLDPAGLSARVRTFLASRATGPTLTSG